MSLKLQKIIGFSLLLLVFLFWGTKTYSEKKRLTASQELDRIHLALLPVAEARELPYLFPLDSRSVLQPYAAFNTSSHHPNLYHSAIDYQVPLGSPVYAVADGIVSFAGEMEGHAGLVIIDHHQEGLHSLYGHLSTQQPIASLGPVKRGEIIGYVGQSSESDGGGHLPHLHFALRLGSKSDYPASGEGRWMADYTREAPIFYGYIEPELFILQTIRWDR